MDLGLEPRLAWPWSVLLMPAPHCCLHEFHAQTVCVGWGVRRARVRRCGTDSKGGGMRESLAWARGMSRRAGVAGKDLWVVCSVSCHWSTVPASVLIQTPTGLTAKMPHEIEGVWPAGVPAIFTIMTYPFCFPMDYGFVVLLFILTISIKDIKEHIKIFYCGKICITWALSF